MTRSQHTGRVRAVGPRETRGVQPVGLIGKARLGDPERPSAVAAATEAYLATRPGTPAARAALGALRAARGRVGGAK